MKSTLETYFGGHVEDSGTVRQPLAPISHSTGYRLCTQSGTGPGWTLPKAINQGHTLVQVGGSPQYVCVNLSGVSKTVEDASGSTIATIPAGQAAHILCVDNSTTDGTWLAKVYSSAVAGSALPPDREAYTVELTVNPTLNFNLRDHLETERGYDGTKPVAAQVFLRGPNVTVGSAGSFDASFATGYFPAGSNILLWLEASTFIHGKGGTGGRGGSSALLAGDGLDGGAAIRIQCDTTLVNYGAIQGGGGGGGGGAHNGTHGGGGGGGGAGYQAALGGAGGSPNGQDGQPGFWVRGLGGSSPGNSGGDGGAFASAGVTPSSGGAGGAAGPAIEVEVGFTLTKLVAGTIVGSEVAV